MNDVKRLRHLEQLKAAYTTARLAHLIANGATLSHDYTVYVKAKAKYEKAVAAHAVYLKAKAAAARASYLKAKAAIEKATSTYLKAKAALDTAEKNKRNIGSSRNFNW